MTTPVRDAGKQHVRSNSQLNDYLHCAHAFMLKRIMKVPEAPSVWLAGGKAFHTATEAFDREVWEAGAGWQENDLLTSPEPWENVFAQEFDKYLDELREVEPDESKWRTAGRKTKDKPNGENVAWWATEGPLMVGRYIDWRTSTGETLEMAAVEGGPGVEVEVTVPVGGVPMIGFVDRLMRDATTGTYLVVDLKTGSRTPASPMQLALYSVQLEVRLGVPVTWGAYFDARKGVLTPPIDLSLWTERKLGRVYRTLDRAVQNGIFLPRIDSHCKACGVRAACIYQGGVEPTENRQKGTG